MTSTHHSGPLPPAAEFQAYKDAHEEAAAWILDEASKGAEHTRAMERLGMRIAARDAMLARLLPFGIVVAFLVVFLIVARWNVWVGGVGMGSVLAAVVLAYLKGFGMIGETPRETDAGAQDQGTGRVAPPPSPRKLRE